MQGSRFVLEPCNVRWRSLLRLRLRCPACLSNRRRLFGQDGVFPRLQLAWKMRQQGARTKGALQRSLALTPPASPTVGDLSQRACELRKVPFESSPALAGMEFTVSSLPFGSPEALREKRQRSLRSLLRLRLRCPFFLANRRRLFGKKGNVRWRSLLRLRLRCPFFLANRRRLFGKKGNVRWHSLLRLRLRLETYPSELVSCRRSHSRVPRL